jgi:hypothetical protein
MAITDTQKTDFLWKKAIFGVTNTYVSTKAGYEETIGSNFTTFGDQVWAQSASIPKPAAASAVTTSYTTTAKRLTLDSTSQTNRTWVAFKTFGNTASGLDGDWIPPSVDASYLVEVYKNDASVPANKILQSVSGQEWVFDYSTGVLTFVNAIPAGITDIYVKGYRYTGTKGLVGAGGASATHVFANIAARNADETVVANDLAKVTDAGDGEWAIYMADADGPTSSWTLISKQDSGTVDSKTITATITPASPTVETVIANPSQGTRIVSIMVDVTVAFDGTTPTLDIGNNQTFNGLFQDAMIDLKTVGEYTTSSKYVFPAVLDSGNKISYTFAPSGSTTGSATVVITYA